MEQDPLILSLLAAGLGHCRVVVDEHGGLLTTLFLAGLVGSASHCVGMCGPFVLAQTVARLEARPASEMREWHRLAGAALVPYHLGRMTTYMLLGAVAALLFGTLVDWAGLRWLSAALLIGAAVFFVGYALRGAVPRAATAVSGGGTLGRLIGRVAGPLFAAPTGGRGYLLGMALGFLPCGLLWGALAAAAAAGSPLAGAFGMLAFTLGTVPALLAVGLAGHVAGARFRTAALRAAPVLLLVNAVALTYLAWRTIA